MKGRSFFNINWNLLLVSSLLLVGCNQPESPPQHIEQPRPAKIFHVSDMASASIRHFPAEVEANTTSQLAFRVNGQIIDFPVKAGSHVTKGQVLVRLDPTDYKLQVDARKAQLELATSQFERAKLLLAKKLIPQSSYDEAKANLSVAKSAYESATTNLAYTQLIAPFDGTVAKVLAKKHETVVAKQTILLLQSRDLIDLSVHVPENIMAHVNKDTHYQPTVIFDSHPDQHFLATVKEWDTQADPTTLTYKVVFTMPTPKTFNVLPGMTASLLIDLAKVTNEPSQAILVPVEAVFVDDETPLADNQRFVWKVDHQTMTVHKVPVTVGSIREQGIEIISGVNVGDDIVSAGVHYLKEGMKVRAWEREKGL
jgi:RND family efflux transporter MFP subunit